MTWELTKAYHDTEKFLAGHGLRLNKDKTCITLNYFIGDKHIAETLRSYVKSSIDYLGSDKIKLRKLLKTTLGWTTLQMRFKIDETQRHLLLSKDKIEHLTFAERMSGALMCCHI